LELARTRKPSVVILDVLMPDPDGYEVCRRLRTMPGLERLAIIMLTVTDDPQLESNSFIAGADLTLRKPFKEPKLLAMIHTALLLKGYRNGF
jgi:putative two-component system response regulator